MANTKMCIMFLVTKIWSKQLFKNHIMLQAGSTQIVMVRNTAVQNVEFNINVP